MVSLSSSSVAADNVEGVELSESSPSSLSPQLAAPFLSTETAVGYLLFSFFLCFFHGKDCPGKESSNYFLQIQTRPPRIISKNQVKILHLILIFGH